ncbi:SseB family protein [Priestia flexa]|uniref:SseB family protein n=1 Tax=Priestia TaxID=2800373 RepID=UPI0021FCDCE5|nr:SseB family protein [Priestia flexa]MDT2048475.1 SseB family protein [Priestia flexa]USY55457.1 SseB family protein [Bacillus sp. 1780r2a1]
MGSSFNSLEKALIEAMKDNREIGHFYKELMKSNLLCIEVSGNEKSADFYKRVRVMEKNQKIYLPAFSSNYPFEKMLKEERAAVIKFSDLLQEINENTAILLNPDTPLSKLLIPEELKMLKENKNLFNYFSS